MFFNWLKDCLIGQKAKLYVALGIVSLFTTWYPCHGSDQEELGNIQERKQLVLPAEGSQPLEEWLSRECFVKRICCRDPAESALYWTGAGSALAVGPAMYSFGADLSEELRKDNRLTGLSPEMLGISSLVSNVVVFSSSAGEALEQIRPATAYEKPLLCNVSRVALALRYTGKIAGPGQLSAGSAFAFTLYNHSRFKSALGGWIYPLDITLLAVATISDYFFWNRIIKDAPHKVKSGTYALKRAEWNAPGVKDALREAIEMAQQYILTAPKSKIDDLAIQILSAQDGLTQARILLRSVPVGEKYGTGAVVYHELIGGVGGIIGIISCYPNYGFTFDLVKAVLTSAGAQESTALTYFAGYLGVCGTLSVAVSSGFGTQFAFRLIGQTSTDVATYCVDVYKKKKKLKCCTTKEDVAQAALNIGRYGVLPATYLTLSLLSIIPQEYIGLTGGQGPLVALGLTTIAVSGLAISYWGFDSFFKKVVASPKRQMLLHATNRMLRLLPDMKDSVASCLYNGVQPAEEI